MARVEGRGQDSGRRVDGGERGRAVAVYDSYVEARAAVEALVEDGFPTDRLAIVPASPLVRAEPGRRLTDGVVPGALVGAVLGFVLYAVLGWADPLATPGLSVVAYGTLLGGVAGAALGWRVQRHPALDDAGEPRPAFRYTIVSDPGGADAAARRLGSARGSFRSGP